MKKYLLATILACGAAGTYVIAKSSTTEATADGPLLTDNQVKQVETIIHTYLQENPKIVMQSFEAAMAQAQQEEVQKMKDAVASNKDKLFSDARSPVIGNPQGTEELVVFMDPYCGYCKKFHEELDKAIADNGDLKVVFKDIAIMGPASKVAVNAMLAAQKQGKYKELQTKIFKSDKHLSKQEVLNLAASVGLNVKTLKTDMEDQGVLKLADDTQQLANEIGVNGTPTLIFGETVHPGYLPAEQLNELLKGSGTGSDS